MKILLTKIIIKKKKKKKKAIRSRLLLIELGKASVLVVK